MNTGRSSRALQRPAQGFDDGQVQHSSSLVTVIMIIMIIMVLMIIMFMIMIMVIMITMTIMIVMVVVVTAMVVEMMSRFSTQTHCFQDVIS